MALYKLPFAISPVKEIYARSREDIVQWLERYEHNHFKVYTLDGKKRGTICDIVEVEKGELIFDFGGIIAGTEYASVDFLPDFTAKIRFESLPLFPSHLRGIKECKEGNLYAVRNFTGGLNPLSYVPQDVFEALKKCNVSDYEKQAERHIESLNRALSESESFHVRPRVTSKRKLN